MRSYSKNDFKISSLTKKVVNDHFETKSKHKYKNSLAVKQLWTNRDNTIKHQQAALSK